MRIHAFACLAVHVCARVSFALSMPHHVPVLLLCCTWRTAPRGPPDPWICPAPFQLPPDICRAADTMHKPGFKLHARILHHLFGVATSGVIKEPLWDTATTPGGSSALPNNAAWLHQHLTHLLSQNFPNLRPQQVEVGPCPPAWLSGVVLQRVWMLHTSAGRLWLSHRQCRRTASSGCTYILRVTTPVLSSLPTVTAHGVRGLHISQRVITGSL